MPENTTGTEAQQPAPTGETLRVRFDRLAQSPYSLLILMLYVVTVSGLAQLVTDAFAFPDDASGFFEGFFNDLWMVVGATGLTLGMIAIVHGIRTRKSGEAHTLPASMSERMLHPVWLFPIMLYSFLARGIIKTLYDLVDTDWGSFEGAMSWTLSLLFITAAGTFFMLALKGVSDWLHAAPDDSTPSASSVETDEGDATEEAKPTSTSSFTDTLGQLTADPDRTLLFGAYLLAYLGLFWMIFSLWSNYDSGASTVWRRFFFHAAMTGGVVSFLLIARSLTRWLTGATADEGEMERGQDEKIGQWAQRLTLHPVHVVNLATVVIFTSGFTLYFVEMWSNRNTQEAVDFWSGLMKMTVFGVIIVGSTLVLRALAAIAVAGPVSSIGQRIKSASDGPLLSDPGQLLRLLIYALALVGLTNLCLDMMQVRGFAVWSVWYWFFNGINAMALPVAMLVGAKAMYAEIRE